MSKYKSINAGSRRLRLKKFDISSLAEHATIAMIAKRGSGKSWLVREIMYQKRKLPSVMIISPTEKLNCFYGDYLPDSFIYNKFETDILKRLYSRQSKLNDDNIKRKKDGKKNKDDRVLLIMDDCMSSKGSWVKDESILELFFNGRHHHISFILTMQYAVGIPPELRSNFDYIFLLGEDFISNRKRLYEHYAGMFPSFDIFQQVFDECTENFGCMVINNKIHSKEIEEKVFWFKAKKTPNFFIGSKKFKKYHKKNYDSEWNKRLPIFDINTALTKRKNQLNLVVEKIR